VDHVVDLGGHQGLARGFMAGLHAALRAGADVVVNTDADNQYNADDIPKLVAPILRGERRSCRRAARSRRSSIFRPEKDAAKARLVGVRFASGTRGGRPERLSARSRERAMQLNVFSEYTYTLETIIQAGRKDIPIASVPIRTNGYLRPSRLMKSMTRLHPAQHPHDLAHIHHVSPAAFLPLGRAIPLHDRMHPRRCAGSGSHLRFRDVRAARTCRASLRRRLHADRIPALGASASWRLDRR
jgi:hypothetical protein